MNTKMIKVTSRGMVTTSRGRVRGPITRPYRENVDQIYKMLANDRPRPTIVEILPNGRTVELTFQNYDKDNELVRPSISPAFQKPTVNAAENGTNKTNKPEQPQFNNQQNNSYSGNKNKAQTNNTINQQQASNQSTDKTKSDSKPEQPQFNKQQNGNSTSKDSSSKPDLSVELEKVE